MGERYLIDTNILIDFQIKIIPQKGFEYVSKVLDDEFIISFISYIEFLGYKNVSPAMESFVGLAEIIEINTTIINQTIQLRKTHNIKLPDAIIAATAMVYDLGLISRNTKDFKNITELKVFDPYNL